jgi:hypothetical protein
MMTAAAGGAQGKVRSRQALGRYVAQQEDEWLTMHD